MSIESIRLTTPSSTTRIAGGSFLLEERAPEEIFTPEDFTEQHRLIADTADRFMRNEVLPNWERIEHHEPGLTPSLLRQAGELGLLSIEIPERYGGMELDEVSAMLVAEKMAQYASFAVTCSAHTGIGLLPIATFGTEAQKEKFPPRRGAGELGPPFCPGEAAGGLDALGARGPRHALARRQA